MKSAGSIGLRQRFREGAARPLHQLVERQPSRQSRGGHVGKRHLLALLCVMWFPTAPVFSQNTEALARVEMRTIPVDLDVRPASLQFVTADDNQQYLVYNVMISNWGDSELQLARMDIEDAETGAILVSYDRQALEVPGRLRNPSFVSGQTSANRRKLAPGGVAWATIGVRLQEGVKRPNAVRHRLTFEENPQLAVMADDGSTSSKLVSLSEPSAVNQNAPVVLGPPLRGGPWRCGNGLGINAHNSAYTFRDTRLRVPQRYGCDFSKLDTLGHALFMPTHVLPKVLTVDLFYAYGAEVLAVAPGRIIAAYDGVPESVPQPDGSTVSPVKMTNARNAGNWIGLDIGGGRYVFYAHLQRGSLRVKVGDRVRMGQVLGLLGNTGNSGGPHLHFHVGNGPSLNGSDGMPYVFQNYLFHGYLKQRLPEARKVERRVPIMDTMMTFPR